MERRKRRWPWVLLAVLAAMLLCWIGLTYGDAQRVELVRRAEAAEAKAAGLIVAEAASKRELAAAAGESETLRAEIERIRDVAPTAEVREVTRWRTTTRDVPYERLVEVPGPTPACPADPLAADLPPIQMYVTGSEARLRSDSGNTFAVGDIEVWRVSDPDVMLMSAPWQADLTTLIVSEPEKTYRRLGFWGGISRRVSIDTFYRPGPDSFYVGSTDTESRYTARGGVSWRWRGLELMLGANTDPGVDLLVAWHRQAS